MVLQETNRGHDRGKNMHIVFGVSICTHTRVIMLMMKKCILLSRFPAGIQEFYKVQSLFFRLMWTVSGGVGCGVSNANCREM